MELGSAASTTGWWSTYQRCEECGSIHGSGQRGLGRAARQARSITPRRRSCPSGYLDNRPGRPRPSAAATATSGAGMGSPATISFPDEGANGPPSAGAPVP